MVHNPAPKLRGQRRASSFETLPPPAEPIADGVLVALDNRLKALKRPARDKITEKYCLDSVDSWGRYQEGGERRASRNYRQLQGVSDEEKAARRARAGEYTIEIAQTIVWLHGAIAIERGRYLRRTLAEIDGQQPLDFTTATYSADAVVDFAFTVRATAQKPGRQGLQLPKTPYDLTLRIEQIGEYGTDHHESLVAHQALLRVVRAEQERRAGYWSGVLAHGYEAFGDVIPEDVIREPRSLPALIHKLDALE